MTDRGPCVSVVVAGADDATALRTAVESVLRSSGVALEVLVVSGAALDAVDALAGLEDERLLVVPCEGLPSGARVNVAIALARAPLVKLILHDGVRLVPDTLAREVALVGARPRCAALLPEPAGSTARDADAIAAGLLERRVPPVASALIRTAALHAVGGVDATLDAALAYDLWLRLVPGRAVAVTSDHAVERPLDDAAMPRAEEGAVSRAEHGFVLARAVHGRLEHWMDVVRRADGCDERAAWQGLAARLRRSGLAEAAPLAREAERIALRPAPAPVVRGETDDRSRQEHDAPREPLALSRDADAVRELARVVQQTTRTRRALGDVDDALGATTERLVYDVTLARRAAEAAVPLTQRALDKLRVGQRIAELCRRAVGRRRPTTDQA